MKKIIITVVQIALVLTALAWPGSAKAGLPGDSNGDGVVNAGEVQNQVNSFTADFVSLSQVQRVLNTFLGIGYDAPIASAGPDQRVVLGTAATLDGSGSSDPNGGSLTYSWTLLSKPAGSSVGISGAATAKASFTPDLLGTYAARLVVNNGKLDSPAALVTVIASASPSLSGKVFSANQTGLAGVTVTAKMVGVVYSQNAVTGGDGAYLFSNLPTGSYLVTPSRKNIYKNAPVVFTPPAQTLTVGNFVSDAAAYKVSGHVTNTAGAALANVKMTLTMWLFTETLAPYTGPVAGESIFTAYTDAVGNYTLSGIPSGFYKIMPSLAGNTFSETDNFLIDHADKGIDFQAVLPGTGGGVTIQF